MTGRCGLMPSSPLLAASPSFLESLYESYQQDPRSVEASWRCAFQLADELRCGDSDNANATVAQRLLYTEWLRRHGHLGADINPLKAARFNLEEEFPAWLESAGSAVRDAETLKGIYAGRLAVELSHVDDAEAAMWIARAMEVQQSPIEPFSLRRAHQRLVHADEFERFLAKKYPSKKRFGTEGSDALIVLLDQVLIRAANSGIDEVVIGSMHRGRLNLMANVLGKDLAALFAEFKGVHPFADRGSSPADISYHLGCESVLDIDGHALRVTLLPNPSHLEAIDPIVLGRVRAIQDCRAEQDRRGVLAIILHTDAAVVGQGLVAETLQLSGLKGFTTEGTVHIVVNNQLGFTTDPEAGRTSRYCTGPWKAIDSLIMHVNGDDIEASIRAANLAVDFRNSMGRDTVIDLVAYRRNGHNEIDEPRFTQPLLYDVIDSQTTVRERFESHLLGAGVLSQADCDAVSASYRQSLEDGYTQAAAYQPASNDYPAGAWAEYAPPAFNTVAADPDTSIPLEQFSQLLEKLAHVPIGVTIGSKLRRLVNERVRLEKGIPWAVGEALALGSLLTAGCPVRLTGQDVARGAFSHRHFALTDTVTGARHLTLDDLDANQARFTVIDSPLSEYAVLGFEYGYSLHQPKSLVIWEAQFGDFANGAQIMIDQFISSGEDKWRQPSGLVMLLPHGLEGQGPEHSSARIERYMQMACGNNIAIVNPSTPANYFHVLRRQILARTRRPLIVIAPKTLLRLPAAASQPADFGPGSAFEPIIVSASTVKPKKILLCSGKIYYELERERQQRAAKDVMIVRIEQLYPMPSEALAAALGPHPAASLLWVQEEPENMGAWSWYDRRLEALAASAGHGSPRFSFHGRPQSCSPAGSFHTDHQADQAAIIASAFD